MLAVLVLLLLELGLPMLFCTCSNERVLFREHANDACGDLVMYDRLVVFADNSILILVHTARSRGPGRFAVNESTIGALDMCDEYLRQMMRNQTKEKNILAMDLCILLNLSM